LARAHFSSRSTKETSLGTTASLFSMSCLRYRARFADLGRSCDPQSQRPWNETQDYGLEGAGRERVRPSSLRRQEFIGSTRRPEPSKQIRVLSSYDTARSHGKRCCGKSRDQRSRLRTQRPPFSEPVVVDGFVNVWWQIRRAIALLSRLSLLRRRTLDAVKRAAREWHL